MRQFHDRIRAQWLGQRFAITFAVFGYLFVCGTTTLGIDSNEPGGSAVGIVLDILRGDDQEMQTAAIAMVREMPGAEITEALAKELPNLSAASQVQLLSAFAERGDKAALSAVVAATNVENGLVRIAALKAMGQLGDATSVNLLAQRAATAKNEEQKAARESLYRLRGTDVDQMILASIDKAEPGTKIELIRSIGERNIYTGVKTLLKTAQDADSKVWIESFKALKAVADPESLPALIELLLKTQGELERDEAEKTVAAVARKIADKSRQAEAVLEALPKVADVDGRCSLLNVLGKIGDDSSLPVLREALKDKDIKVQDSAIRALSDWPNPGPIDDLLSVAQKSDNKVHRVLALRGYVRLVGLNSNRPAEETISMYKQAMNLAPDATLKATVLSGLANVRSFAAIEMACEYLNDSSLQQEAELAVVKIAAATSGSHPQETKAMLNKVIATTKNDSIRRQAQEVINKIK